MNTGQQVEIKKLNRAYFVGLLLVLLFIFPLAISPVLFNGTGIYDWEHIHQRFAAVYLTYFKFQQFPGNNIWIGGGIPLLQSYSGYGLTGLATLLTGPVTGTYLSVLIYYVLGYVGAIKLASLFTEQTIIKLFFALYTVFGNALAWHLTVGHVLFSNILLLPYILYYLLKYRENFSGAKAGLFCGVAFLDNAAFTSHYFLLIVGIFIVYLAFKGREKWGLAALFSAQFLAVYIALIFFRIYLILPSFGDFSVVLDSRPTGTNFGAIDFLKFSIVPYLQLDSFASSSHYCRGIWENANYISITAFLTIIYVAIKRSYIYLAPIAFLFIAFSNNSGLLDAHYYFKQLPTFSSLTCTARIRLLSPYAIGLALVIIFSGRGVVSPINRKINRKLISSLKKMESLMLITISKICQVLKLKLTFISSSLLAIKNKRVLPSVSKSNILTLLMLIILAEVYIASTAAFIQSHKYERSSNYKWNEDFQNYKNLPASVGTLYEATLSNIGIINSTDSHISSLRVGVGKEEPRYIYEYTQNNIPIRPTYWSPNIIIFETKDLENCIQTNIPIGNLWSINGMDLYADKRSVEVDKLICAYPDDSGRVELKWHIRNAERGIIINIFLIIVAFVLLFYSHTKYKKSKSIIG